MSRTGPYAGTCQADGCGARLPSGWREPFCADCATAMEPLEFRGPIEPVTSLPVPAPEEEEE